VFDLDVSRLRVADCDAFGLFDRVIVTGNARAGAEVSLLRVGLGVF
jgi:hypothetical protein